MEQARSHSRSGQSLVEAMIAISLLLVGFLGTIALINRSVGLTRVVADSYTGTYLASEGIEVAKSLIDGNYLAERAFNTGFEFCASGCEWELDNQTNWETQPPEAYRNRTFWYDPVSGAYSYQPFGTETTFKRKVTATLKGSTGRELEIVSRVEWRGRGGGVSSVALEDHFYDWYVIGEATTTTSTTP